MEKSCKTCKYRYIPVSKGFCIDGSDICDNYEPKEKEKILKTCDNCEYGTKTLCQKPQYNESCNNFSHWRERKVEDKTYTTGQMIDILLANKNLKAETESVEGLFVTCICGKLCWRKSDTGKLHADFVIFLGDDRYKWRIIEPAPKHTYKSVLLEKFPKCDAVRIIDVFNPIMFFDCKLGTEWTDEYKEEGDEG